MNEQPESTVGDDAEQSDPRRWRPLSRVQRRVAGVLVEKAKTTPDAYPLTLNGLTTGCNQKSNRSPQMSLTPDDVQQVLDDLREMGAVIEVQSSSRTAKFRHCLYDWLGVDKTELAVMAELLLRGEQTVGELRGRAARMEPIGDLAALKPILESLEQKQLLLPLTPAGRGQTLSHNLYEASELQALRQRVGNSPDSAPSASNRPAASSQHGTASQPAASAEASSATHDELRREIAVLRERVGRLEDRLDALEG